MPGIEYTVRRSDRARRVRVSVALETGVQVVLPRRAPERAARDAVVELRPWIERRLQEVEQHRAVIEARRGTVPLLGEELLLVAEPGRTRAHLRGNRLLVPPDDARPAIERWYRRRMRAEVEPRVEEACAALGVECAGIAVRGQRTRWGSCSSAGVLSFNWRLLLAPPEILGYVVWHEACHLCVHDHSDRFWSLLARHLPDYAEPARWLRRNGATLVL